MLESLKFTSLWIGSVYDIENHWDRLRVIGSIADLDRGITQMTLYPIRQRIPSFNVKTRPEMAESGTAQILAEYNTVANLCEIFVPRKWDMLSQNSLELGRMLKFLLRMSNATYPAMFTEFNEIPSALSDLGQKPSPLFQGVPILDIHAFEEKIMIIGGPVDKAESWPAKHPVKIIDYTGQGFDYRGFVGEDITVPATISDYELGVFVTAVWNAKRNVLGAYKKSLDK